MDENRWIEAIIKGDQAAFEQLYNTYSDRIYNTIISYTKNEEDAQEVLQDVFVTVYRTVKNFKFQSSAGTWIYRIAVNKSLDFLRNKKAAKRFGVFKSIYKKNTGELEYEESDFVHPGVKLENKEESKYLFKAIDALSENQKTAFILTQIEGLPHKEVAEIMKTSAKSVESLIQRAKANLRVELKKYYPERGK